MSYIINPKCPKCGNILTVKMNIVDQLKVEIAKLKRRITDLEGAAALGQIFNGFK